MEENLHFNRLFQGEAKARFLEPAEVLNDDHVKGTTLGQ